MAKISVETKEQSVDTKDIPTITINYENGCFNNTRIITYPDNDSMNLSFKNILSYLTENGEYIYDNYSV